MRTTIEGHSLLNNMLLRRIGRIASNKAYPEGIYYPDHNSEPRLLRPQPKRQRRLMIEPLCMREAVESMLGKQKSSSDWRREGHL